MTSFTQHHPPASSFVLQAGLTRTSHDEADLQSSLASFATDIHICPEVEQRLDVLTRVTNVLGVEGVSFASYSNAITRMSSFSLSTIISLNRLSNMQRELQLNLAVATHLEQLAKKWTKSFATGSADQESAAVLERRQELLLRKAKEYRNELTTIMTDMPEEPTVTITDFVSQQDHNRQKAESLKIKREKIRTFQGLPPNLDAARQVLRSARDEQMKLIQLRERLLGRMAESVA